MLKRNNIAYSELTQSDDEIQRYPTISEEISLLPSNVRHSKFLIMEPKNIKMAIMQLKTYPPVLHRSRRLDEVVCTVHVGVQ
jgi:hypothetical protein